VSQLRYGRKLYFLPFLEFSRARTNRSFFLASSTSIVDQHTYINFRQEKSSRPMSRACDVRNPNMRGGMSPAQIWRDYVRVTVQLFKDSGIESNQYGDGMARKLDKAA
jgi:hypothetical protein